MFPDRGWTFCGPKALTAENDSSGRVYLVCVVVDHTVFAQLQTSTTLKTWHCFSWKCLCQLRLLPLSRKILSKCLALHFYSQTF